MESLYIEQFVKEHNLVCTNGAKSCKIKPVLPEYHLDFGHIVYGLVASQTVCLTNPGPFPVSFSPSHSALSGTGFSVDIDKRIKGLPPDGLLEFTVTFDPASVHSYGNVEAKLPFQVRKSTMYILHVLVSFYCIFGTIVFLYINFLMLINFYIFMFSLSFLFYLFFNPLSLSLSLFQLLGGPIYPLRLSAQVALPMMEISLLDLNFGLVLCGQCHIITLRLYNPQQVK